jgi:hypothetical protein
VTPCFTHDSQYQWTTGEHSFLGNQSIHSRFPSFSCQNQLFFGTFLFPPKIRSIIHHEYIYKPTPYVTFRTSSLSFTYGHHAREQMQTNKKIRNHDSILHTSLQPGLLMTLPTQVCTIIAYVEILHNIWYYPFHPDSQNLCTNLVFCLANLSPPPC